jgi:protein TonB
VHIPLDEAETTLAVSAGDNVPPVEADMDSSMRAYSVIDVDSAAARDPESDGPVYPEPLRLQGVEGAVIARFVVDSTGRVDLATFEVMIESHPMFTAAVREALPRMKYKPAKRNERTVRQLVEQQFGFRVVKPTSPNDPPTAR